MTNTSGEQSPRAQRRISILLQTPPGPSHRLSPCKSGVLDWFEPNLQEKVKSAFRDLLIISNTIFNNRINDERRA